MPILRRAIREREVLHMTYHSLSGEHSERVIRPLQTDYWGRVWTLSTWCETRKDFRAFRIDRVLTCKPTGRTFEDEPGKNNRRLFEACRTQSRYPLRP
ncbi:MAG: WYL domain-containing protein [Pseudomonadota bacterium]